MLLNSNVKFACLFLPLLLAIFPLAAGGSIRPTPSAPSMVPQHIQRLEKVEKELAELKALIKGTDGNVANNATELGAFQIGLQLEEKLAHLKMEIDGMEEKMEKMADTIGKLQEKLQKNVGCVTEDGQRIPVNGTREVNDSRFTMVCQQFHNGTVIFHGTKSVRPSDIQRYGQPMYPQYGSSSSSSSDSSPSNGGGFSIRCNDENGYARNVGEYWVENHRFNKTCRPNGAVEVANCVSKDGYRIPLNDQLIRDGAKYSCKMTPQGTIRFKAGPVDE